MCIRNPWLSCHTYTVRVGLLAVRLPGRRFPGLECLAVDVATGLVFPQVAEGQPAAWIVWPSLRRLQSVG